MKLRGLHKKHVTFAAVCLVGVSLSEPHIDHDNSPAHGIMTSMYHLPCVCCTLIPEIHVRPEMLCVFWYIDVLMFMIVKTVTTENSKDRSYTLYYQQRPVGECTDTWYKQTEPTETVEPVVDRQLVTAPV